MKTETYTLKELAEQAEELFERHEVNELHATTDGQFFKDEKFARLHAGEKGTVHTLTADGKVVDGSAPKPMPVPELTAKIAFIENVEELNALLEAEQAGSARKTAIKAIQERIAKLSA